MGSATPTHSFTSPPTTHTFSALLFDMDGTIIDSTPAVIKHWHAIGEELGVDPATILATSHGRRSIDVLAILSPEKATWDYVKHMEGLLPLHYSSSAKELPGARPLISSLDALASSSTSPKWAIVTSGTTPLVSGWLKVLQLPQPAVLVVAEDVPQGKPDPTCYLMGKEKLGLKNAKEGEVLVLEDSPAGIVAGKKAGCRVVAVVTTHTVEQVVEAGADWVVRDLGSVKFVKEEGGKVVVEIRDALVV